MLGTVHYASTYLRFARAYMLQYNKKQCVLLYIFGTETEKLASDRHRISIFLLWTKRRYFRSCHRFRLDWTKGAV